MELCKGFEPTLYFMGAIYRSLTNVYGKYVLCMCTAEIQNFHLEKWILQKMQAKKWKSVT